ncbi:Coronin-like protein crn1 [Elasticomyces elasticus]|nr:Coronin-like protein crn1 [Elasticomyces elasticus]KAK3665231.1 Coronin-like protein crn1 [Elasticomyces elasticus]KAK4909816.1 Coronin-like protein crn1 [Elasticomyces elasticus]KAK5749707.1 Coronin-like protein crn1 [Elasticomyces elasticus]
MSGRFVRASKYRHVFGKSTRREATYDNLRISKNAWDTNLIKVNPKYLAVNWEASGGGAFAVIPLEEKGKLPEQLPLFRGHTAAVLDTDWNPFNDDIIASGSDDGKVFVWKVPDGFTLHTDADEPADVKPVGKLSGHSRKVGHVLFNPAAENVLASSSGDYTVKIWDLEDGHSKMTLKHNDIVQSLSWSANGSMMVTTSRDKKLRFWDVRQEKPAHEVQGHMGAKSSRSVWMGEHDRIVTTGFSKMSERQLGLWDLRDPSKPVGGDFIPMSSSSAVSMPFWDEGTQMLYMAGKGDGNITYFEYEHDKFEPLSEYKSPDPQRGMAFMPKRGVNTHENELARAYKTVDDRLIEPIPFIVPRRSETFQDDIYPATVGLKPAMSSSEWLDGKTGLPPKFSMEDMYEGKEPQEYAAQEAQKVAPAKTASAPAPAPAAAPTPKEPVVEKPEPTPAVAREMPSMKDNKQSMSALASKFADKDEDEADDDDDTSSFEEIQKPVERPNAVRQAEKNSTADESTREATRTTTAPAPQPASVPIPSSRETVTTPPAAPSKTDDKSAPEAISSPQPSASAAAGGLRDVLQEIRGMLQSQGRQIEELTSEVAQLKTKVGQ